jgi:hypothetical protein
MTCEDILRLVFSGELEGVIGLEFSGLRAGQVPIVSIKLVLDPLPLANMSTLDRAVTGGGK